MSHAGPSAWLVYAGVRVIFAIMQCFPLDWNLRTARWLARIWSVVYPRHLHRAENNLEASFPGKMNAKDRLVLARECLESAAMLAVEAVCLPRLIDAKTWPRYVRLQNFDEALRLLLEGKGAILVTAHYGSFELTGHVLACLGFDVLAVMRPVDNAHLNRFLVESRRRRGLKLVDKRGATAAAQDVLARGGLLAFIGDQDAGPKGRFVQFFDRWASTYKSIGLLAISKRIPIVVGCARRLGPRAQYEIVVQRIIKPEEWENQADELAYVSQAYTSAIEEFVRAAPGQYWWMHRRWKTQPTRLGFGLTEKKDGAHRAASEHQESS